MNAIVVVDQKWAIGREGGLLFSLPTDMKRFRALTLNGTVILGRKTLDTFPGGRPLPKRRNIVISHQTDLEIEGAELVGSLEEACVVDDTFRGEGWGVNTPESSRAVGAFARREGILVEHVYNSKVLVGMEAYIRNGRVPGAACYLHTGGFGSLFAQY